MKTIFTHKWIVLHQVYTIIIVLEDNLRAIIYKRQVGESENLGSIEPGKLADIIAVDQDPLEHIETMQKVSFVMKGGVVYKK